MKLIDALKMLERGEMDEWGGKFLYLQLGSHYCEIKLTQTNLNRPDWAFVIKARKELAHRCRDLLDSINYGDEEE